MKKTGGSLVDQNVFVTSQRQDKRTLRQVRMPKSGYRKCQTPSNFGEYYSKDGRYEPLREDEILKM